MLRIWNPYGIVSFMFSTLCHALSSMGSYHSMSNAPVIPSIIKSTNVSMPRKPSGLTNLPGKVNFIPMNMVRSTPAYTHRTNLTKLFSYVKVAPISNYSICMGSHVGGSINMSPLESTSRPRYGRTFEGGPCSDAGPAKAWPVAGSYILPWHGHSPLFRPSSGQYFHRHHRCRQIILYALKAEASFLSPPSSFGSLISCHVRNDSLFSTGSSPLG